jgi:hypothetical protein
MDDLLAARAALNAGDPRRAYVLVTTGLLAETDRTDLYLAAAESLRWLGQPDFAVLYELAASKPTDRDTILALAQQILANGDAPVAVAIAGRAVDLDPVSETSLALLALAWAADFQPSQGRETLLDRPRLDFDPAFALSWCSLLCGEIDGVLSFIEAQRADLGRFRLDHATQIFRETWIHYLEDCLARRVTIETPRDEIRTWHFIQYGSTVLDCCPDLAAAGGRFTATWRSYRQVTALLKVLLDLLIRVDRRPLTVAAAPGRDSAILGRVVAELLEVPFRTASATDTHLARALIVAAHGRDLDGLPLWIIGEAQTVFAFDFNWLTPGPVVPDVSGMLSLSCTLPWHAETAIAQSSPPPGPLRMPGEAEVVRRLLAAEGDTHASALDALPFYAERAGDMKGRRAGFRREQFRRDSPVPTLVSWRGYV